VRNVLAAGWCTVEGDDPARHAATLTEDDDAAEVVAAYLGALGRPSAMWPFPSDAPAATIREHLNEIAVFRLTPGEMAQATPPDGFPAALGMEDG
jgi:hypothetical protein